MAKELTPYEKLKIVAEWQAQQLEQANHAVRCAHRDRDWDQRAYHTLIRDHEQTQLSVIRGQLDALQEEITHAAIENASEQETQGL